MTIGTTWEHAHNGFVKSVKIVITLCAQAKQSRQQVCTLKDED